MSSIFACIGRAQLEKIAEKVWRDPPDDEIEPETPREAAYSASNPSGRACAAAAISSQFSDSLSH
jgi:hypothetical protein